MAETRGAVIVWILGGEGRGVSSAVAMEREAVDHERVAQEVEQLALVADALGSAQPQGGRGCG